MNLQLRNGNAAARKQVPNGFEHNLVLGQQEVVRSQGPEEYEPLFARGCLITKCAKCLKIGGDFFFTVHWSGRSRNPFV